MGQFARVLIKFFLTESLAGSGGASLGRVGICRDFVLVPADLGRSGRASQHSLKDSGGGEGASCCHCRLRYDSFAKTECPCHSSITVHIRPFHSPH